MEHEILIRCHNGEFMIAMISPNSRYLTVMMGPSRFPEAVNTLVRNSNLTPVEAVQLVFDAFSSDETIGRKK